MMSGLSLGWQYLTGYAVATDPGDRNRAEWPPHPGRIFLALAATHFETGASEEEAAALRWLELLGDPRLYLPSRNSDYERTTVRVFVPVNDKADPAKHILQSFPALTRDRQERTFPRIRVGDDPCYLYWPQADQVDKHFDALNGLCLKVTRIGHSSSMVRMWAQKGEPPLLEEGEVLVPDDGLAEYHLRVVTSGTLDSLPSQTQIPKIQRYAELVEQIVYGDKQEKNTTSKRSSKKSSRDRGEPATPPRLLRPRLGIWRPYRRPSIDTPSYAHSHFDTDLLILKQTVGLTGTDDTMREVHRKYPLVSTLTITQALRHTILSGSVQPPPAWLSGHESDGDPLRGPTGHIACIPLPFVGGKHADGHLLGVAIAFPRSVPPRERGRILGPLLLDSDTGQPKTIGLRLGAAGIFSCVKSDWTESRKALQAETWTAHPHGAIFWASVTPVVLNRFPHADRNKDRQAWTQEVAEIVAQSCEHIGLPAPIAVDVDTMGWHNGTPRAIAKKRRMRSGDDEPTSARAALGEGFPVYPPKGTRAPRIQVHVWLRFDQPVIGPILLGAGRHLGYGLCKPWELKK